MRPRYFWLPTDGGRHVIPGAHYAGEVIGQRRATLCGMGVAVRVVSSDQAWLVPTCQTCHDAALRLPHDDYPSIQRSRVVR